MYSECEHELEVRVVRVSVYKEIKNCPRNWKVVLNGRKANVSSDSVFGAQ